MRKSVFFPAAAIFAAFSGTIWAEPILEPFTYTQNFESRAECG